MKKTLINIWAYDHHAIFTIEHDEDTAKSVEKAILDKLGEKSIKWEYLGNNYNNEINRITYEVALLIWFGNRSLSYYYGLFTVTAD